MRIRYPFAIFFAVLLLVASSLGLLPHSALPSTPEAAKPYIPRQSDKFLHFLVFFALTITFYFILDTSRKRVLHLTLGICTLVLAVGSEVAQGLLPNDREFDPWDVLANVTGSLCALALATWYHKRSAERKRRAKYSALMGEGYEGDDDDLELGEGPGPSLGSQDARDQEEGVISIDKPLPPTPAPPPTGPKPKTMEEELDNWDENEADTWSDDENDDTMGVAGPAKITPATSSAGSEEAPRKKFAVD